ncbi:MAG TPA: hypothetical protein VMA71_08400 [Alloacidobacterium sp.]|nr:hypothetical protein [Alloacidobacterium sp.]
MIQTLIKSWWLLALCGVLNAIFSIMVFLVLSPDGSITLRRFIYGRSAAEQLGVLALAIGACTVAAGIWNLRKSNSWLLVLNGLACGALGLLVRSNRPVAFRTLALFIVVMAVSIGVYQLATARTLRQHRMDEWLLGAAGIVSFGFALAFLAFVLHWLKLDPSPSAQTFNWLGSYFGFSAVCMLGLAALQLKPGAALHSALPTH